MSRVIRFTVTPNVEFLGLAFWWHSILSDSDLMLSTGEFYYPPRANRNKPVYDVFCRPLCLHHEELAGSDGEISYLLF